TQPSPQMGRARLQSCRTSVLFFITNFVYAPSQTPVRQPAMIHRECTIENSARLQRRFRKLPQIHFSALFDNPRRQPAKAARTTRKLDQFANFFALKFNFLNTLPISALSRILSTLSLQTKRFK